jgi:hypothetical protein
MSLSSFKAVCLAAPVMRQVALMEVPSTRAAITWVPTDMAKQFIDATS